MGDVPEANKMLSGIATNAAVSMDIDVDEDIYRMNRPKMGVCVIINNRYFDKATGMDERSGTDVDAENLKCLFTTLGFDVRPESNKKTADMLRIVKSVAQEDHTDNDCFVCAILSHGDTGIVYGTDGIIQLETLFEPLKGRHCQSLVGKPKVFIIQACRSIKLDEDIDVANGKEQKIYRIPEEADFLYAYSTVPGYFSWRNPCSGSWFIQALCEVFKTDVEKHHILTLLTKVNRLVAYDFQSFTLREDTNRKKLMPSIVSMLTKQLYLQPKK